MELPISGTQPEVGNPLREFAMNSFSRRNGHLWFCFAGRRIYLCDGVTVHSRRGSTAGNQGL